MAGKEISIYSGNSIEQWNLFGLDQVGDIKSNGDKFFYLKDHLGSIRAILDSTNTVVVANDYDCWGYPLEYRSYEPVNQRYKFTGKERDKESSLDGNGYDYFGARYYDSRIANWLSIDPLFEKHFDYSPYNYVLKNPLKFIDPEGKQLDVVNIMKTATELYFGRTMQEFIDYQATPEQQAAYYGMSMEEYRSGRNEPNLDLLLIGGLLTKPLTIGASMMERTTPGVLWDIPIKHALKRVASGELTRESISQTLMTGEQYVGHSSGYMTIIGRNILKNKSVVLGYDLEKQVIVTAYKTSNKKADKLVSLFTNVSKAAREYTKDLSLTKGF